MEGEYLLTLEQFNYFSNLFDIMAQELKEQKEKREPSEFRISYGDFSAGHRTIDNGNSEYLKDRFNLEKLAEILNSAKIVSNSNLNVIGYGTKFSMKDDDGEEIELVLVPNDARSSRGEVSIKSPLGKAVFGKEVGDDVSYFWDGKNFHFAVTKIFDPLDLENKDKENSSAKTFMKQPSNLVPKKIIDNG